MFEKTLKQLKHLSIPILILSLSLADLSLTLSAKSCDFFIP
jgi:hypothetical protein